MKNSTRQTYRLLVVLLSFAAIVGAALSNRLIRAKAQEGAASALAAQKDEVAFASKRGGSKYGLYTLHPDGTSVCNTLGQSACTTGGSNFNIFDKATPAWSPDGTKLAFASNKDTFSNLELYIYDDNTQAVTRLTTSPNDSAFPTWSPDGTRIAFMNGQLRVNGSFNPALIATSSVASQIFIVNSSGGTPTPIAPPTTNRITPAWSPNANQNTLVYARQSTTSGKYFLEKAIVNNDNTIGAPTALTSLPPNSTSDGNNLFPAWSPDGARIAFTSDRINPGDALGDIWIMNADATGLVQFTTSSPQFDIMPVWSPDGTQIAWTRGALGSTDTSTFDIWRQTVDASSRAAGTAFNITNNAGEDSQATWRSTGAATPTPTPTATPTPTPTPTLAPFTLTFEGRLRDKVSRSKPGLGADGDADGTFSITLASGAPNRTVTKLDLVGENGNRWDTDPTNRNFWIVGVAPSVDGALLNNANGSVSFDTGTGDGSTKNFYLFVPDSLPSSFVQGKNFTLNITFSNGQTISASTTIGATPANSPDLRIQVDAASNPIQTDAIETYTIRVQNLGPSTATNVKATITLPSVLTFVDFGNPATSGCTQSAPGSRQISCTYSSLALNAVATSQIRAKAVTSTSSDSSLGRLDASVTSDLPDPIAANSNITNTISVVANANPPANDNFANAQGITGAHGTLTGTNVGATKENPVKAGDAVVFQYEPNHGGNEGGKSVWYTWRPPSDFGTVTFDTRGSTFDTLLAVYDIDKNNPSNGVNIVAQNDNFYTDGTSQVTFPYRGDHLYVIAVDGYKGASGNFNLNVNATPTNPTSGACGQLADISQGIFPSAGSRIDVDPQSGYFIMHVKGTGFTSNSLVIIDGDIPVGTTLDGRRATLTTQFVSSQELIANIPPLPVFNSSQKHVVQVITPLPSGCSGGAKMHTESIPDGTYSVAADSREFIALDYQLVTLQSGETKTICFTGSDGKQTCDDVTNFNDTPLKVTPSVFALSVIARSQTEAIPYFGAALYPSLFQAFLYQLNNPPPSPTAGNGFALNSAAPLATSGSSGGVGISVPVDIPPAISAGGTGPLLLVQGGGAGLLTGDGAGVIAAGGGNVIAAGGGNILSEHGAGVIAAGGGNLIGHDGGSLIGHDGGSLAYEGGGDSLRMGGGNFAASDALSTSNANSLSSSGIRTLSAADLQVSAGWFVVRSSGGKMPTYTSTTDSVDGTTKGKLSVKFDETKSDHRRLAQMTTL